MTTAYSQRDPRWAQERLGTSALTLGEGGCLVCSVASLLADYGVATDPARLNAWLVEHGGFVDGGRLVFGAVEPLGARLRAYVDCYATPANLARIGQGLALGWGVLALVDARPGCDVQAHWVRIVAVLAGPRAVHDCLIMDPWRKVGDECTSLRASYGCRGWTAARSIFMYVGYERVCPAEGRPPAARALRKHGGAPVRVQPAVHWRPSDG